MKSTRFGFGVALSVLLIGVSTSPRVWAQPKEALSTAPSAPPTGTYAPLRPSYEGSFPFRRPESIPPFTLHLETNGTYVAEAAVLGPNPEGFGGSGRPDVARGTWRWDAQKREFQLEPGDFTFYIKRLPVDKHNPSRLVWGSSFLERQDGK